MHHGAGIVSAIVNILIIFFVFNLITKAVKKSKRANQGDDRTHANKPVERETKIDMSPGAKNLKHEQTISNKSDLQLKRCSNCGGEIPLTMMKCDLCGQRQAGCSSAFIIILVVVLFILFLMLQDNGMQVKYYFNSIMGWLSSL